MREADRQRLSAIAHATSSTWGPISDAALDEIVERVVDAGVGPAGRVIDLGCGPAELLRRVVARTGGSGTGVDTSPFALTEARRRLAGSPAHGRIDLRLGDATTLDPRGDHDLVICIGPGWKSGGWSALAAWASGFATAGGLLLLGEGAWRVDPSPDALARLGLRTEDYRASSEVVRTVAATGASVIWSRRAAAAEWAAYADDYRAAMRAFARDHPDDPVTPALLERSEAGWADYETLHELLDFVIVLARSPRPGA